jgi:tape measure domain-containing protein
MLYGRKEDDIMLKLDIQMFADGKVVIDTELNTKNFERGLSRIQDTTKSAGTSIKNIVAGLGITKLISSTFSLITSNLDSAISRFDTLNNFPKVMSNLGISAKEGQKSIDKMSQALIGLPTTLDEGAMAVQRFTSKNGDVAKSTDLFLALNNAILAGGASSAIQSSALEQLSQSYAKGKPDMMEWRTAMMAMPAQLKQVALAMGYIDADALGEALREGTISMDEFMNTIVKLNTEGVNGFKNFEEQARNSTGGIQTAMTNMRSRVTQGVTAIIESVDKGLAKSGMGGLAKMFEEFGNTVRDSLKKVGKQIEKVDFKKLINSGKKLIPIIGSLTAGFVAYNGAIKAIKIAKTISNFARLTRQFVSMIPVMKGAKLGMIALNSSFAISPIGVLIAGIAGLTAGLYLLKKTGITTADSYTQKTREQIKANEELIKSQKESNKEMQNKISGGFSEIQYYKNLQTELKTIVDENGKIKAGYEDRAKVIVGILNKALGTEAKVVNGVVQGYKEYNNEIDKLIKKKKAKIILDSQEEQYTEAIKNQLKYQKQMNESNQEILKWNQKIKDTKEKISKLNVADDRNEIMNLNNDITRYKSYIKEKTEQYNTAKKITEEYTNDIVVYEKNLSNFEKGNYDAMIQNVQSYVARLSTSSEERKKALEKDIESEKLTLDSLKEMRAKTHSDIYDEQIKSHERTLEQYKKELADTEKQIKDERNTWLVGTQQTISELSKQQFKFQDLGNGYVQSWVNGVKVGKPVAYKNLEDFGNDITKSLQKSGEISSDEAKKLVDKYSQKISNKDSKEKAKKGVNQIADTQINALKEKEKAFTRAGENTAKGIVKGATNKRSLSELHNAGTRMGNAIEEGYKSATKIHSPSRLFEKLSEFIPEGIAIGINKNKGVAIDSMKRMASSMYSEMERAVNFETGKMQANVETGKVFNTLANTTPVYVKVSADVEMDKTKVGRIITPVVSETLKTGGLR